MYTAPTLRSACSHSSCNPAMSGVEGGSPRPFSWGCKGDILFREREYPPFPRPPHGVGDNRVRPAGAKKEAPFPRLLIRKHEKVSKINVFKGREHGTKSKNLILTGTKGADFHISALFLSSRHRQPPYGVFSYPCLYPPEKCIN